MITGTTHSVLEFFYPWASTSWQWLLHDCNKCI